MRKSKWLSEEALRNLPYTMIDEVTSSREKYEEFLQFYSRFYKYNIVNALMIYGQSPDATAVGTYEQWKSKEIGRGVRLGAFPIRILQNGNWETAFDITDTNLR